MRHPTLHDEPLDTLLRLVPYLKTTKNRSGTINVTSNDVPNEVASRFGAL